MKRWTRRSWGRREKEPPSVVSRESAALEGPRGLATPHRQPAAPSLVSATKGRLGLLGIALRAGRLALGTRAVSSAARRGRLALLVLARDASRHAVGRLAPEARVAPRVTVASREALGRALGRREVAVVGVTDKALAARILTGERAPAGDDDSSGSSGDPEGQVP